VGFCPNKRVNQQKDPQAAGRANWETGAPSCLESWLPYRPRTLIAANEPGSCVLTWPMGPWGSSYCG